MDPSTSTNGAARAHGYLFTPTEHNDTYPAIDPLKTNLSGKKVLITGAARGIGREIAIAFAKGGASAIVLLDMLDVTSTATAVTEAAQQSSRDAPAVIALTVDITQIGQVQAAADQVETELGDVDILINNAGYLAPYERIGDSEPEKWWRNWEVNVKGVYLMTRSFLPLLLRSNEKTVVVLSSVGAHHTLPGGSGYETTKLAVLKLNSYLMAEYGHENLLAYAVAPGGVKTAMGDGFPQEFQHLLSDTPNMVADTIVFLTQKRREWLAARYVDSRWDMPELLAKEAEIVEKGLLKVGLIV